MKHILMSICAATALLMTTSCQDDINPLHATFSRYQVDGVTATAGDEEVTLQWVPQDGKPTPEEYYITWTTSSADVEDGEMTVASNATSVTIPGLINDVIYTFGVQAKYPDGLSQKLTVSCQPKTSRIPVSDFKAMAGDKRVFLSWTAPETPLMYTYEISISANGEVVNTVKPETTATSCFVDNLTNGVEYTFSMICVYNNGNSEASVTTAIPGEIDPISVLPTEPRRYELTTLEYNPAYFLQGEIASVVWSFEDGYKTSETIATYCFPKSGANVVTITVTYTNGKTDTASTTVNVLPFAWSSVDNVGYQKASNIVFAKDGQTFYTIGQSTKAVYAVSAITGQIMWQYGTVGATYGAGPVVAPNGNIIFGTEDTDGTLYALSANGTLRWSVMLGGAVKASPAVTSDGVVYALCEGGILTALDSETGAIKWTATQSGSAAGVAVDKDGTIYMATNAGVWAYTSNGTLKWTCDEALKVTERGGSLAIGNGILYAVLKGKGGVAAINTSNGKVSWTRASEQGDCYHPVLDSEGTVYFCEKNGGIYAVTSSGSLKWRLLTDLSFIYNGFAIGADNAAYISEYASPFNVIKVDNGGTITELGTASQSMAPVTIGPDQRLYYGLNGSVTTVDIAVGLSTTSTWPCRGANQQGTNSLR